MKQFLAHYKMLQDLLVIMKKFDVYYEMVKTHVYQTKYTYCLFK